MLSSKVRIYLVFNKNFFLLLTYHMALDHAGVTPLIEAVRNNHVDIVKVLLDRGSSFSLYFPSISQHLRVQ